MNTNKIQGEIQRASRRQTQNIAQSSMKKRKSVMNFGNFGWG